MIPGILPVIVEEPKETEEVQTPETPDVNIAPTIFINFYEGDKEVEQKVFEDHSDESLNTDLPNSAPLN